MRAPGKSPKGLVALCTAGPSALRFSCEATISRRGKRPHYGEGLLSRNNYNGQGLHQSLGSGYGGLRYGPEVPFMESQQTGFALENSRFRTNRWGIFRTRRRGRAALKPNALVLVDTRRQTALTRSQKTVALCLLTYCVLSSATWAQGKFEYSKQAGLDPQG